MYHPNPAELRALLIQTANEDQESTVVGLRERPVILLAPLSWLGMVRCAAVATELQNLVAVVDDVSDVSNLHGVPRWTSTQFLKNIPQLQDVLVIDFSTSKLVRAMMVHLCQQARVEKVDCVVALAELNMVAVYETAREYRSKTLERLDDFLAIGDRLADDLSKSTLYANLLFRLTYDRSNMLNVWADPEEEYFSGYAAPSTFSLGSREHFVDCGAYQGPVVNKFLASSGYRYESITAIEPDRLSYQVLKDKVARDLPRIRTLNKAVSDRHEKLGFLETGTVGSSVSESGNVIVDSTTLDFEVEHMTLLKMDVEGHEARTLHGAANLLRKQRPRIAACVYHYACDLLDVMQAIDSNVDDYHFRLRQHHGSFYYDCVLYASPVTGVAPPSWAA